MAATNETGRITADFGQYVDTQVRRLTTLRAVLETGLPIVSDLARCNEALTAAGRPDLVMAEGAVMISYGSPEEVLLRANNFSPNFWMNAEIKEVQDEHGFYKTEKTPVTEEMLREVRGGSLPYVGFVQDEDSWSRDHSDKPAFQRMIALFPDFTILFVLSASQSRMDYGYFSHELFVAYQLMSQLADVGDKYVMRDGAVDGWYLCR